MGRLNLLYLLGPLHLSKWDNNEIRYSLRSMSNTNDIDWVGITGPAVPPFLKDICHIQCEPSEKKFVNLIHQLSVAMSDPRVPEDLILMNDDFYMRETPPWDWTPTHLGPTPIKWKNTWQESVAFTGEVMRALHIKNPVSYEGHTPMPIKKSLARTTLDFILQHQREGFTFQFRTAYGNMNNIGGKQHVNAKHKRLIKWPEDSPFLSTVASPIDEIKNYITSKWPEPSRWEIPDVRT